MVSLRRLLLACCISIVGLFTLDALLFRTNLYPSVIEPDSAGGQFELTFSREREFLKRNPGNNIVATLGDSRFAYQPRLANQIASQTGYIFRHAGVAGTNPRTWYYMLRDLDPTARRYAAIVIGLPDFDDEDEPINQAGDGRDMHYLEVRLRLADTISFAESFPEWRQRWLAARGALLKGFLMQRDIQEFLQHPVKRIEYVRLCHRGYEFWTDSFEETERSMAGIQVDWNTGKYTLPPGADDSQRDTTAAVLMKRNYPQTGKVASFRRLWLGRITDRYRGSPTPIVFVRLPRGPVPPPDALVHTPHETVRDLARRQSNVVLCPEHTFDSLEQPELFKDALHLNRAGIARFSPMLAETVAAQLHSTSAAAR